MDKYYILRIGIAVIFIIWLMIPTSNENICKNISSEMSADRSSILDSITKFVNTKEGILDTIDITHMLGQQQLSIANGVIDKTYWRSLAMSGALKDHIYKLNPMPERIKICRTAKVVVFYFHNHFKISTDISVIYMDNKIDFPICEYRVANYPPWHLKHWVYEIRPQWYILHNKNTNKFIQYYDSMRISRQ